MLASDIIYQSLRKIGQLRPGYTSQTELMNDALVEWTAFFDECGAERNTNFSNPYYQYSITGPGSQTNGNGYLLGPAAQTALATATTLAGTANDWNGPRPEGIIRANLVLLNVGSAPIYIGMAPLNQSQWAALGIQKLPAIGIATCYWYDPQYPNGVFNVFPPLNANAVQIYQWGVLVPPATLATAYSAPPGYQDFVVYGLAERLYHMATKDNMVANPAPYGIIAGRAYEAREKIKLINRQIPRLATDFPSGGRGGEGGGFFDRNVSYTGEPY